MWYNDAERHRENEQDINGKELKMSEETTLAERPQQTAEKPKRFFSGALRMVKGENSAKLIEDFTSEMTLVAEGLCEDQSKLRREVDQMMNEEDRRIQKLSSRIDLVESSLDEEKEAHDRDLTELRGRLATLEKRNGKDLPRKWRRKDGNIIRDLTWLVGVAGGAWIIVTIINKFF